jgi:hypothetical protein
VKVENQIDDAISSNRSKRALSIASSRKTFKMRNQRTVGGAALNGGKIDSDTKSKQGDSVRDKNEKKENISISIRDTISGAPAKDSTFYKQYEKEQKE